MEGRNLRCLPYGERSEASRRRALARKRQGAERGGVVQPGLEHPPVTRKIVGSNPITPANIFLAQ